MSKLKPAPRMLPRDQMLVDEFGERILKLPVWAREILREEWYAKSKAETALAKLERHKTTRCTRGYPTDPDFEYLPTNRPFRFYVSDVDAISITFKGDHLYVNGGRTRVAIMPESGNTFNIYQVEEQ